MSQDKQPTLRSRVQAALDEIRPYIQADGGDVELVAVENGIALVRLMGHCVGCSSSQVTLRAGIETRLKAAVPEIVGIEQAPDEGPKATHSEKTSPFAATPSASGSGTVPAQTPAPDQETVTNELRALHRQAEKRLIEMETALDFLSGNPGATPREAHLKALDDAEKFFIQDFATHTRQEDEVLFPALIPFISWGTPMSVMAKEHRLLHDEIANYTKALNAYKAGQPADDLVRIGRSMAQRLRDDFFQEENVLFVEADDALQGARAKALREAMNRIAAAALRDREVAAK